ncbi:hypothetical protein HMPREF0044_1162 [Gleimia coleocanis DSM 15436]|uniref:Uncharacterized protein n=1 Tax=Gleimia coleocanis DSM 15436 TaxID=525245 RepID=C0W172_9ACTO|nr:hypothetical protein [Gleimia coleocanis]EEH63561.1 hypothetical protein HMPREF0044_1162 [Gleimia coleocanis DSM 15436]
MERNLTAAEAAVLEVLLLNASSDQETEPTAELRNQWVAQIPNLQVVHECGCGACPTIDFTDPKAKFNHRIVLSAFDDTQGAGILVFIDDNQLSCLEVYPSANEAAELPAVENISF